MARKMGYRNYLTAEQNVLAAQKLARPFRGNLSTDTTASTVLFYMCEHSNDWPLTAKQRTEKKLSRIYSFGLEKMAIDLGMITAPVSPAVFLKDPDGTVRRRRRAGIMRVHNAIHTLEKAGVVENLGGGYPSHNAFYLLLIGDEDENHDVEAYDRRVLGLD